MKKTAIRSVGVAKISKIYLSLDHHLNNLYSDELLPVSLLTLSRKPSVRPC